MKTLTEYEKQKIDEFRERFGNYRGARPDGISQLDAEEWVLETIRETEERAYQQGEDDVYKRLKNWKKVFSKQEK